MKTKQKRKEQRRSTRQVQDKKIPIIFGLRCDPCITPCSRALQNPLVLSIILEKCETSELIQFRLVNNFWMEISTSILVRRSKDLRIKFRYNTDSNIFVLLRDSDASQSRKGNRNYKNSKTLEDLNNVLRRCRRFPCVNFEFIGGDLGKRDFQNFLTLHGKFIKSIRLDLSGSGTSYTKLRTFRNLLLNASNIETLLIDKFPIAWHYHYSPNGSSHNNNTNNNNCIASRSRLFPDLEDDTNENKKPLLPKLTSLIVICREYDHMIVISDLLKAAKNLKCFEFKDFDIKCVLPLMKYNKTNLLEEFFLMPLVEEIEQYEAFVQTKPRLKSIILSMIFVHESSSYWSRMSNVISMLLECSRETLNLVHLTHPIGFLREIVWPTLSNVTELHVSLYRKPDEDIFNNEYKISKIFPSLKAVYLNVGTFRVAMMNDESWAECFPFTDKHPNVKTLEILDCPRIWFEKLLIVFPCVDTLKVFSIKDFPAIAKLIWKFKCLKSLDISIDIDSNQSFPVELIDSCFTGLSADTCARLNKAKQVEIPDLDKHRLFESIVDLKNLTYLSLKWVKDMKILPASSSYNLISSVTGRFAFKMMEGLKVDVSIRPYNNIPSKKSHVHQIRKLEDCLSLIMKPYANCITKNGRN